RLNRTEYRNAVRDLLDLDIDVAELLPVDNASYGFDNIAGTLMLNGALLEQYLSAAQSVASAALGTAGGRTFVEYRVPYKLSQEDQIPGTPLGTRGGAVTTVNFPADGEYLLEV